MAQEGRNVEFASGNTTLRGVLRMPPESGGTVPLVVMAHGMGGLKEWGNIPTVSDAILATGIATLAFDYRNFGDSEGLPREFVDHEGEHEDYQAAITFASQHPDIDSDRIGIWGTSLGGGKVLVVASRDRRVKCVVAQVPTLSFTPQLLALMGGFAGDVEALQLALDRDKADQAAGREPLYVSMSDDDPNAQYAEHFAAFSEREHRNWKQRFSFQALDPDAFPDYAELVADLAPAALRLILTDHDMLSSMGDAARLYELAQEPKSMVVLPGHHYSLYTTWKHEAAQAASDWFAEYLKSPGEAVERV